MGLQIFSCNLKLRRFLLWGIHWFSNNNNKKS